jgi:iron-sulfur cluster repair protein YtfE (RIC family)
MKRHEALQPLSRAHHDALILARLLQKDAPVYKGLPQEPGGKAVYALNFFKANLVTHFIEEEVLLQQVKKYNNEIAIIAEEVIIEHQQLLAMFNMLPGAVALAEALDKLGKKLEAHIRKEERVLFPLIQEHCPEDVLKNIVL